MQRLVLAAAIVAAVFLPHAIAAQTASSYPSSPDQIQPLTVGSAQDFATQAAGAGSFEIQSSQLALTTSQDANIKAFAQMMIADHSKAAQGLQTAAAAQGGVTVPSALDPADASKLQQLQAASGASFDKLYVEMQIDAHIQAVGLFAGYAQIGAEGPLKSFAVQTLPTLKMHYQHAIALPH